MKKPLLYIMIFCLFLNLTGCFRTALPTNSNTIPDAIPTDESPATNHTDTEQPVITQLPMVAICLPTVFESKAADDGTVVFNHTYQNISLFMPEQEVADKIIIDYLNRSDTELTAEEMANASLKAYSEKMPTPYWLQVTHKPTRIDRSVISLFGTHAAFNGAAHAEQSYSSVTYDVSTGNTLTLNHILEEDIPAQVICQLVLDSLAKKEGGALFSGYEITVQELFNENYYNNESWYLSDYGLHFFFSPYEIGPYSSGDVHANIPYEKLTGILKDAYFPPEHQETNGSITAQLFSTDTLSQYTQLCELTLDPGTTKIILSTDSAISNIKIATGTWNAQATAFTENHTVFAAAGLTIADAVIIELDLEEKLPPISISYQSGGKTVVKYLSFDANANTPILKD